MLDRVDATVWGHAVVCARQFAGRLVGAFADQPMQHAEVDGRLPAAGLDQRVQRAGLPLPLDPPQQRGGADGKAGRHVLVRLGARLVRADRAFPRGDTDSACAQ